METLGMGAAAVAAATGGVGAGLFSYNRGNYMFDQKSHYARFTAGLNMAIAQTNMYKADIEQLTELTVSRQDTYHGIAAMGLTILTAIYCPGRVGLHTPPPPGWLMGLEFVNIAGCYMFLGLCLWLAMHASMRADTASTHMLTRFVRLPIPSQGMLDKARKFLASFEEQPLQEAFRVPFTRHQRPGPKKEGGFNEGMDIDPAAKRRARNGFDVPAWYRKEKKVDYSEDSETIGLMMPMDAKAEGPEHFEAYREIQMEWFPYDVYARICIFLAFMHLTHCWAYLQIGHLLQEQRSLFACAIVMLPMFVLQNVILTLDIIPSGFPFHRLGPLSLWTAYIAAVIEYKRWFTPGAQAFGFFLVYVSYGIHIVYTLALLRLCRPADEPPALSESPGASWWPGEWRLPTAFQHAIWLVAPPRKLPEGQVDLVGEFRAATGSAEPESPQDAASQKRKDVHRALGIQGESPAWVNVKIGLIVLVVAWVWLSFGFTIEVLNQGTAHPSLLNAMGMPNNARDPRYRPAKPGRSEPTEVGTGGVAAGPAKGIHSSAIERRLAGDADLDGAARGALAEKLRDLLPYLRQVQREGLSAQPAIEALPPPAPALPALWPALFEPQVLACGPGAVAAISRHGSAALLPGAGGAASTVALLGASAHGAIAGAAWDEDGLLLATRSGAVLECPGAPEAGRWRCAPAAGRLPLGANFRGALAVARAPGGALRAAVLFPGEGAVALYARRAAQWLPTGEARVGAGHALAAFDGEALLLAGEDGAVDRMDLGDGSVRPAAAAAGGLGAQVVAAICANSGRGGLMRLAVAPSSAAEAAAARVLLG